MARLDTRLSKDQVTKILRLGGTLPKVTIAARFGVSPSTVSNIIKGRIYKDVYASFHGLH